MKSRLTMFALLTALALLTAACSSGTSDDDAAESPEEDTAAAEPTEDVDEEGTEDEVASEDEPPSGDATGASTAEVGDSPDFGVTSDTIRIAWMGDVTGPTAAAQSFNLRGAEAAVAWVNSNGGVLGRELEMDVQDDQFSAETATTNYAAVTQDDPVLAIVQMGGSHISTALASNVSADGIPVVSLPQTIDAQLDVPNMYNNIAHYGDEADVAVAYMADELDSIEDAVVAVAQLEVPSGDEWNLYIEQTVQEQGGTYAGRVTFNAASPDYAGAVTQIQQMIDQEGVNFIAFHGSPENGLGFVGELTTQGITDVPIVGIHGLAGATVYTEGPAEAADLLAAAHSFLSPMSDCEMCKTALDFVQGTEWEGDANELNFGDGWQDILIVQQAIERVAEESGELTWETMNAALTSAPFDVGGITCNPDWTESNHTPCAAVFKWDEDHPEPIADFESYADVIDGEYGLAG